MIGWFGPALLLALFAAASLSSHVLVPPDAAVAAQVEVLVAPVLAPRVDTPRVPVMAARPIAVPRELARHRRIDEGGLPPPRAPTC